MTASAYLFDLDGVIIDSLKWEDDICNDVLQKRFPGKTLSSEIIKANFGYAFYEFWKRCLNEIHVSYTEQTIQEIIAEVQHKREVVPMDILPGVVELLKKNRNSGILQAVVSNNPEQHIVAILNNIGLISFFDHIVGNDEHRIKKRKPAPDCYLLAASELKVDPKECVVIEDSDIGVQAGKAAGAFTIGVTTGGCDASLLKKCGADRIVASLMEIV